MNQSIVTQRASSSIPAFLLCVDLELAWGWAFDGSYRGREKRILRGRVAVPQLLDLLDRYAVPATWATVGHLFLGSCERRNGVAHPEIARPRFPWLRDDWFAHDPAGSAEDHPLWFAPDLVRDIRRRGVGHEIGSHSFSHLLFGSDGCTEEAAATDLQAAIDAAREHGLDMKSFVYPRHMEGFVGLVARHGFTSYRASVAEPLLAWPAPIRKPLRFLLKRAGIPPPPVRVSGGMQDPLELPASMLFTLPAGQGGGWITGRRLAQRAMSGIRKAESKGGLFTIYFHDHNLGFRSEEFLEAIARVLAFVAAERDAGRLATVTMHGYRGILRSAGG